MKKEKEIKISRKVKKSLEFYRGVGSKSKFSIIASVFAPIGSEFYGDSYDTSYGMVSTISAPKISVQLLRHLFHFLPPFSHSCP